MKNNKDGKLKEYILRLIKNSSAGITQKFILNKIHTNENKLNKILDELSRDKKITISKGGKLIPIISSGNVVAEIIFQSRNFVLAKCLDGDDKFFVSKHNVNSSIIGDKVIIDRILNSEKGLRGNIKKIIEFGKRTTNGTVLKTKNGLELLCDSDICYNIPIIKSSSNFAKNGDKVKAILFRSPSDNELLAKIIKIYGKSENAKVCANALIESRNIPISFTQKALAQAEQISCTQLSHDIISSRLDLRNQTIFTIDGENAKDLDDAISINKLKSGWELGVHIADVSHYIKQDTQIDKEAYLRGSSIYLPDMVIPMIPKLISNGVCSLNAGQDKLTFSAIINLDNNGEILSYKFAKSIINSKIRGVYSEINRILEHQENTALKNKYSCVLNSIYLAKELSTILSKNSKSRGTIEIFSDEPKFTIDENGICINVETSKQGIAENIIENFMIVANRAAALYAKQLQLPFIYRVHNKPESKKIETLSKLANILGINSKKIRPGIKPSDMSELLEKLKGLPSYRIMSRQILQSMSKARYSPEPLGHFGLSLEDYCHFTSPIRRYPDICIHRILKDIENSNSSEDICNTYSHLVNKISVQSTACEIQAMKLERDINKYYVAEFMSKNIGKTYVGIISGINSKGIFIDLENSVSGFLDLSYYKDHNFIFDGITCHTDQYKNKKLSIGDTIKIKVSSINISLGTVDFQPAE